MSRRRMKVPLTLPQRDKNGNVIPHDHPEIESDDGIIRRISRHFIVEKHGGGKKLSTMTFKPSSEGSRGVSVDIERLICEAGLRPTEYVTSPKWMGSLRLSCGDVRGLGFQVGYEPMPDNHYHGSSWGNFGRSKCKLLLSKSRWFVELEGVEIHA